MSAVAVAGPVWTGLRSWPWAAGLVLAGGAVVDVAGPGAAPPAAATTVRLPPGAVAVPGFVDPHLHLLALAAEELSVDCRAAPGVAPLLGLLADGARRLPPGSWLRAVGYDEALLPERRHPTLAELDAAVPDRPLVVRHVTGHLALVNSAALRLLAAGGPLAAETDAAGRPTGVVPEPATALDGRVPRLPADALRGAAGAVAARLAAAGVVAIGDATHTNDVERLAFLAGLVADGIVPQRFVAMVAPAALAELVRAGARYGAALTAAGPAAGLAAGPARTPAEAAGGAARFRLGHGKVMPDRADVDGSVAAQLAACRAAAWPAAVHCVEVDELAAALRRLGPGGAQRSATPAPPAASAPDRIEHAALALPEQVAALAAAGVDVVANPAFVIDRAAKYRAELSGPERAWLHRTGSLLAAGVRVAAASDAPTGRPEPLHVAHAAMTRGDGEAVDGDAALRMVTLTAATVSGLSGGLAAGGPADLVVLDRAPTDPDGAAGARVLATLRGGEVLHAGDELPPRIWAAAR